MSTVTKTTTLDEVDHDRTSGNVTVTWRDHFIEDGKENDAARVARTKTYTQEQQSDFNADVGPEAAAQYAGLFA